MNPKNFEDVLELLNSIKAEIRDTTEPSVSQDLDRAIEAIQNLKESKDFNDDLVKVKALNVLGEFLNKIPSIVRLLEMLSGG